MNTKTLFLLWIRNSWAGSLDRAKKAKIGENNQHETLLQQNGSQPRAWPIILSVVLSKVKAPALFVFSHFAYLIFCICKTAHVAAHSPIYIFLNILYFSTEIWLWSIMLYFLLTVISILFCIRLYVQALFSILCTWERGGAMPLDVIHWSHYAFYFVG